MCRLAGLNSPTASLCPDSVGSRMLLRLTAVRPTIPPPTIGSDDDDGAAGSGRISRSLRMDRLRKQDPFDPTTPGDTFICPGSNRSRHQSPDVASALLDASGGTTRSKIFTMCMNFPTNFGLDHQHAVYHRLAFRQAVTNLTGKYGNCFELHGKILQFIR